jgi:hypothetical protein
MGAGGAATAEFDASPLFTSATNRWVEKDSFDDPENLSVDVWVKPTARPAAGEPAVIFDSDDGAASVRALYGLLVWMDSDGYVHGVRLTPEGGHGVSIDHAASVAVS